MKYINIFNYIILVIFQIAYSFNYHYFAFDLQLYANNTNNYDNVKNFEYSYLNSFYYREINYGLPEKKYIMQVNLMIMNLN